MRSHRVLPYSADFMWFWRIGLLSQGSQAKERASIGLRTIIVSKLSSNYGLFVASLLDNWACCPLDGWFRVNYLLAKFCPLTKRFVEEAFFIFSVVSSDCVVSSNVRSPCVPLEGHHCLKTHYDSSLLSPNLKTVKRGIKTVVIINFGRKLCLWCNLKI